MSRSTANAIRPIAAAILSILLSWDAKAAEQCRPLPAITEVGPLKCDGFDVRRCAQVAISPHTGVGAPRNRALALVTYRHIFNQGIQVACDAYLDLQSSGGVELARELQAEAARQKLECDKQSATGCYLYAFLLQHGIGTAKDGTRAANLFESWCDKGDMRACYRLAGIYYRTNPEYEGRPPDLAKARSLYERSCKVGCVGCNNLGNLLREGAGGTRDVPRALRLFERDCARLHGDACANLGRLLISGKEVVADFRRGKIALEKGCALGTKSACFGLGTAQMDGTLGIGGKDGHTPDYSGAYQNLRRGCALGDANSCYNLGFLDLHRKDGNLTEAETVLRLACGREQWGACGLLGSSKIKGPFAVDRKSGIELLERACDHGDKYSCHDLESAK